MCVCVCRKADNAFAHDWQSCFTYLSAVVLTDKPVPAGFFACVI